MKLIQRILFVALAVAISFGFAISKKSVKAGSVKQEQAQTKGLGLQDEDQF